MERTLWGLAALLLGPVCAAQSPGVAQAPAPAVAQVPALTFAHDIAPIVYEHCASCHRPGESGPFPLLTFDDVKKHARQIVTVTQSRFMPPWLPQAGYGDFTDENRLTPEQIRKIADWVAQGTPEGVESEIPPPPQFTSGWQLGPPDLIVEAPEAFTLQPTAPTSTTTSC